MLAVMVPFGAAASPDLTILPVFLAATAAGTGAAIGSLIAFAVATIGTITALTVFAAAGGYQVRGEWLERWGNAFTAGGARDRRARPRRRPLTPRVIDFPRLTGVFDHA